MRRVCFFDLATHCGVAFDGPDPGRPVTRLVVLPRASGSRREGFDYGRVYAALRAEQQSLIAAVRPEVIGYEAYIPSSERSGLQHKSNEHALRILRGLVAVTEEIAWTHRIACVEKQSQSIKKYIAGHGRTDKAGVIFAVRRLGWDVGDPPDDNRADAAGGWALVKAEHDKAWSPNATPLFARRA